MPNSIINRHCNYCNKTIKYSNYWITHLKTKRHIKNVEKFEKQPEKQPEGEKTTEITTEITTGDGKKQPEKQPEKQPGKIYGKCKYCDKEFKYQQSLSRHQKYRCKMKEKTPPPTQIIQNITNNITNITNDNKIIDNKKIINNVNNNNLHITLNTFGQEKIHFSDKFLYSITNPSLKIQEIREMLMDEIYSLPENKTLVKTNLRDAIIYKQDEGWKAVPEEEAIKQRIENTPYVYRKNVKDTIKSWNLKRKEDEEIHFQEHKEIADKLINNKPKGKNYKKLYTKIRLNSYNDKHVKKMIEN